MLRKRPTKSIRAEAVLNKMFNFQLAQPPSTRRWNGGKWTWKYLRRHAVDHAHIEQAIPSLTGVLTSSIHSSHSSALFTCSSLLHTEVDEASQSKLVIAGDGRLIHAVIQWQILWSADSIQRHERHLCHFIWYYSSVKHMRNSKNVGSPSWNNADYNSAVVQL